MTEKQKEKLEELKDKAFDNFISDADFDYSDWLDDKEREEYLELNNLFLAELENK